MGIYEVREEVLIYCKDLCSSTKLHTHHIHTHGAHSEGRVHSEVHPEGSLEPAAAHTVPPCEQYVSGLKRPFTQRAARDRPKRLLERSKKGLASEVVWGHLCVDRVQSGRACRCVHLEWPIQGRSSTAHSTGRVIMPMLSTVRVRPPPIQNKRADLLSLHVSPKKKQHLYFLSWKKKFKSK